MIQRGRYYQPASSGARTILHIPLSTKAAHRSGMYVGVPVFADPSGREHLPLVDCGAGWASTSELVWLPVVNLGDDRGAVPPDRLAAVEERLAETLLLPELAARTATIPVRQSPPGTHPLWGRTYYSGPPIGGQSKRWIVVSHDVHNAQTGRSICVRTTSNLSMAQPGVSPSVEEGGAVAVCADIVSKRHARYDLSSAKALKQCSGDELVKIARALTNTLELHQAAGLRPRGGS